MRKQEKKNCKKYPKKTKENSKEQVKITDSKS